jgi:hypothetical protein
MIVNIARIGTATVDYQTSCFARMRSKLTAAKVFYPAIKRNKQRSFRLSLWLTKEEKLEVVTTCYHLRV